MAVAVKPNRETTSPSLLDRLPIAIVMGVLYVLGCIGILFPLLDTIWWRWLGLDRGNLVCWVLLLLVTFAAGLGLTVLGLNLLGPKPSPGLRAGITFSLIWIFVTVLLTEWIGLWIEGLVVNGQWFGASSRAAGLGLTAGVGAALLILGFRFLLGPKMEARLAGIEEQGWFSTTAYKRSQGMRVRRGTILGILVLAGFGLYSLHQTLNREGGDWTLAVPFTDHVQVTWDRVGDNPDLHRRLLLTERDSLQDELDRQEQAVGSRPDDANLREVRDELEKLKPELTSLGREIALKSEMSAKEVEEVRGKLEKIRGQLLAGRAELAKQDVPLDGAPPGEPVVSLDRFELDDENRAFTKSCFKIKTPGRDPYLDSKEGTLPAPVKRHLNEENIYREGEIVRKSELEQVNQFLQEQKQEVENEKDKGGSKDPNLVSEATPEAVMAASGPTTSFQLTMLPGVKYTIPLLLAVVSLWLAWRLVNVPTFADFLIATEAEMNKVSWATRRQLAQDTVVVLVTVVLMTIFLFFADVVWSQSLRWIGVLQSGDKAGQQATKEVDW
jgi:preprotein translocase SecE subunit